MSCLHDITIYSIQVKMAKDHQALTINLALLIMTYETKDIFIDNKKVIHLFKKKKKEYIYIYI